MTIGNKLYVGFGSILAILVILFVVNIFAGLKERSARADATTALESVRTIGAVRDPGTTSIRLASSLLTRRPGS